MTKWLKRLAAQCSEMEYKAMIDKLEKPKKRQAYRARTGKESYMLEVFAGDKERMKCWLKREKLTQAGGLKKLLDMAGV
jgi:hypothetical protein